VTAPPARQPPFAATSKEHAFYAAMALVLVVLVAGGFAPSFFMRDVSIAGPVASPVLVHGIAGTAWVLLFAAQIALVATHRAASHRRAGWAGAVVTVAFVASGAAQTAHGARGRRSYRPRRSDGCSVSSA
jgi:hypothetical protein